MPTWQLVTVAVQQSKGGEQEPRPSAPARTRARKERDSRVRNPDSGIVNASRLH